MSKITLTLLCLLLFGRNEASLKLTVNNVKAGTGNVRVDVYNSEKDFLNTSFTFQIKKASGPTMEFSFNMPPGKYALVAYQDLNDNKQMDFNFLHIPKEPYGFSNHFRPRFSAPGFNDCSIQIEDQTTASIDLK
jgi:uncharacterized protein (DUF2141 family)